MYYSIIFVSYSPAISQDCMHLKVCVQGVLLLGGHFATLCQEVDFYEAIFALLIFKKKRQILLHI